MARENKETKRLSREQIIDLYKVGPEAVFSLVEYLQDSIQQLSVRVRKLELQVNKDSHNSNKPPSTDGFGKKSPKQRIRSGKKPGGQKGHEGKTLQMSTNPDKVRVHEVECCESCGCSLKHIQPINYGRRQVFDIPPIAVEVTEHQAEIKKCDQCGAVNTAAFPEGVTHKVQYGDNLKARALYLKNYCLLPYDRAAELFEDFFGAPGRARLLGSESLLRAR